MLLEEIEVGKEYVVRAINSDGSYVVNQIRQRNGTTEIIAKSTKGNEAHSRTFLPEQILKLKEKASKAQNIVSETLEIVNEINGYPIGIENITYWPEYKKRGRPRKNAIQN